ncbi:MAG: hypothetical protein QW162_02135 [Ignisphaera sp.]
MHHVNTFSPLLNDEYGYTSGISMAYLYVSVAVAIIQSLRIASVEF